MESTYCQPWVLYVGCNSLQLLLVGLKNLIFGFNLVLFSVCVCVF